MPKLVTVKADETAVLISNERPFDILGPGRHVIWIGTWKRIEYFPKAQQKINISNISIRLPQAPSESFSQMRTRVNFVAEGQIDITFFYKFAEDSDLFETVKYAPKGAGNISDRIPNLIREEIMAKVSNFTSQRTWDQALWTTESLQKDLNKNIMQDDSLAINQLKLSDCRIIITKLNLPQEFKVIANYHVQAEGRHIKVDAIMELLEEYKEKFDVSGATENLAFLLSTNGDEINNIISRTRMNFVMAPVIESLLESVATGTGTQQEKDFKRFIKYAESHQKEVEKLIGIINNDD